MELTIQCKGKEGRISLMEGKAEAGYLTFDLADRRLAYATHTVVQPEYQGQGLAAKLVAALVDWCDARGLLIEPVCSYVQRLSERPGRLAQLLDTHSEAESYIEQLRLLGSDKAAEQAKRYFKTNEGAYGAGDIFLGVRVPVVRSLRLNPNGPTGYKTRQLSRQTLIDLWASPYHEARLLGYHAIAQWAEQVDCPQSQEQIYQLYLEHAERCNNWDLVDCSAPQVIGMYWAERNAFERSEALRRLAQSPNMWIQRIAIVGTLGLIRRGIYQDTFILVEELIGHKHDLIHKASGWMLRELGKHAGLDLLRAWLDQNATRLARTALRYAIEHLPEDERQHYLCLPR